MQQLPIEPPPTETPSGFFTLIELALELGVRVNHVRMRGIGLLLRERMTEAPQHVRYATPWPVCGEDISRITVWPDHLRTYASWLLTAPMHELPMPRVWAEQDRTGARAKPAKPAVKPARTAKSEKPASAPRPPGRRTSSRPAPPTQIVIRRRAPAAASSDAN